MSDAPRGATPPTSEPLTGAPGEILFDDGDVELNGGREAISIEVTNTGDRAIQVGSHFHFFEVNSALKFPRDAAFGRRLDIPSGTAVRFEAGQTHTVALVPYGGRQKVLGFQGITNGRDLASTRTQAKAKAFEIGDA